MLMWISQIFLLQAAVEEGIVVGGGCTLLRLASKVDPINDTFENDEQKVIHLECQLPFFS